MGRISSKQKLGKKLHDLRKSQSLSQEQLSFMAKIDRSYISEIENGLRNPSLQTLEKLAKALKVKLSDLTSS
jgi:transcriptional regulator with XRE-family HTH domain